MDISVASSHIDQTLRCRHTTLRRRLIDYQSTLLSLICPRGYSGARFTQLATPSAFPSLSRLLYGQLDYPGDVQSKTRLLTPIVESRMNLSTLHTGLIMSTTNFANSAAESRRQSKIMLHILERCRLAIDK